MAYIKLAATLKSGATVTLLTEPNDCRNSDDPRFQQHAESVLSALRREEWISGIDREDGFPAALRCSEVAFIVLSLVD
jgi:hypothetical protein